MTRDQRARLFESAGRAAHASAIVSAIGVVFLVLLYVGLFTRAKWLLIFGPLNDVCVLAQYALALPLVLALHRLLTRQSPRLGLVAVIVGVAGIVGVVVFQSLLLAGLMSFRAQVPYASASILLIGVWIVIASLLGRQSGDMHASVALIVLAFVYFGYPVWAYKASQQLLSRSRATRI